MYNSIDLILNGFILTAPILLHIIHKSGQHCKRFWGKKELERGIAIQKQINTCTNTIKF